MIKSFLLKSQQYAELILNIVERNGGEVISIYPEPSVSVRADQSYSLRIWVRSSEAATFAKVDACLLRCTGDRRHAPPVIEPVNDTHSYPV